LDQIYGLRDAIRSVTRAVEGQPPAVRDAVLRAIAAVDRNA
jgi:hypothetical protein